MCIRDSSKSVSLSNIIYSYNVAGAKSGVVDEFALNDTIVQRLKKWGALAADLHTDMHECIGHASGQINSGVETTDKTLKNMLLLWKKDVQTLLRCIIL